MLNYEAIKYEVEQSLCSIHKQHPEVTITETQDNLRLACCCEEFKQSCIDQIQSLLAEQAQKAIMDVFNDGLKNIR